MKVGILLPQGWAREYAGWPADQAWARTVELARQAERLGFESIWFVDHFQTTPEPSDELTFEAFTTLSALATLTTRVRLGPLVACYGFRNPALLAKMAGTLDVISGGRFELALGAGWKEDEWRAYGYGFPPLRERLAGLDESLEVIVRMLGPGHATFDGQRTSVRDAINLPKGLQSPRIPIIVGGNGPEVTWRIAARHADEVNLDGLMPDDTRAALPVIAARCTEIGRDPATLRVSLSVDRQTFNPPGPHRHEMLEAYREIGLSRLMISLHASVRSDEALEGLAEECRAAGAELVA
jgi:F420-dependent oxidoreductase-like protein